MPITVAVADDSPLLRDVLQRVLARRPGIEVVASCEDLDSLLDAAARLRPDVVLTDLRMPPTETDEGIRAAVALGRSDPGIGVLVLGQAAEPAYASALLASGPGGRGYLLKERAHDGAGLAAALASVAAGGSVLDPKLVAALLDGSRAPGLAALAAADLDVLARMVEGRTDDELAAALSLTGAEAGRRVTAVLVGLGAAPEDGAGARVRSLVRVLGA